MWEPLTTFAKEMMNLNDQRNGVVTKVNAHGQNKSRHGRNVTKRLHYKCFFSLTFCCFLRLFYFHSRRKSPTRETINGHWKDKHQTLEN